MDWWINQEEEERRKKKECDGEGHVVQKINKNKSVTIAQLRPGHYFPPRECVGGGAEGKAKKERLIKSAVDVWDR